MLNLFQHLIHPIICHSERPPVAWNPADLSALDNKVLFSCAISFGAADFVQSDGTKCQTRIGEDKMSDNVVKRMTVRTENKIQDKETAPKKTCACILFQNTHARSFSQTFGLYRRKPMIFFDDEQSAKWHRA